MAANAPVLLSAFCPREFSKIEDCLPPGRRGNSELFDTSILLLYFTLRVKG